MNILSCVGLNLQSEVCLWTLLGLIRTVFDATLFKVNANLKQVWQMSMPPELSLPIQRVLRTMISGVMLVQCFTVYVYLASYIVLLYPEERPALVLPWLLLAAIRKLLCELTSLALGLGTCVLLGPARPPCIKFLISKILTIMPAVYMWTLVFGYYHNLKMAAAFKSFPTNLPVCNDNDCGLELAVRRRRTKSLQGEDQLRKKLIANFYNERPLSTISSNYQKIEQSRANLATLSTEEINSQHIFQPLSVTSNRTMSDIGTYEDWFGSEVIVPRDTDRILEQFVIMLLRIGAYLNKDSDNAAKLFNSNSMPLLSNQSNIQYTPISQDSAETPPLVGSSQGRIASYLRDYPKIFMKKPSDVLTRLRSDVKLECDEDNESNYATQRSESRSSIKSTKDISLGPKENASNERITQKESNSEIHGERRKEDFLRLQSKETNNTEGTLTNEQNIKSNSVENYQSVIERDNNKSQISNDSKSSRGSSNQQSARQSKKRKRKES